jgi:hypothetical protein
LLRSSTSEMGLWKLGGSDLSSLRIKCFLWIVPGSRWWQWLRHKALSDPLCVCTSLVVLWHLLLVAMACMIFVRPLPSICWINEIKAGRMHLFNAEAGAAPFWKKVTVMFDNLQSKSSICTRAYVNIVMIILTILWWCDLLVYYIDGSIRYPRSANNVSSLLLASLLP